MKSLRAALRTIALVALAVAWTPAALILLGIASIGGRRARVRMVLILVRPFCRSMAKAVGLHVRVSGEIDPEAHVYAANHVSWLDILALGSTIGGVFVSRHDVRQWPGIGFFARLAGTVFVDRSSITSAKRSAKRIVSLAADGCNLLLFPEGKTTSGESVESFRRFLFREIIEAKLTTQPVTIRYERIGKEPVNRDNRDTVYWYREGDNFARHAWNLLKAGPVQAVVCMRRSISPESGIYNQLDTHVDTLRNRVATGIPVWNRGTEIISAIAERSDQSPSPRS